MDQWLLERCGAGSAADLSGPLQCLLKWLKDNEISGSDWNELSQYAKSPDKTNIPNLFSTQFGMPQSHQKRLEPLLKEEDSPTKVPLAVNTTIPVDEGSARRSRRSLSFGKTAQTHSKDEQHEDSLQFLSS